MASILGLCDWPERLFPGVVGMCSRTIGSASKRQGFHSGRISPGSWAASRCPSADTQTVVGDLKKRCSWRMAEGFSKKKRVRDPGAVDIRAPRKIALFDCAHWMRERHAGFVARDRNG